ncbi:MAG: Gfo/Idh/MocA family oxidoreductase [Alphaproteobacteria bacterium]
MLKFGLIGAGGIGLVRRAALQQSRHAICTAVADVNPAAAQAAAHGARVMHSAIELCQSDVSDAVIISTPPDTHEELAIAAMQSGKHVIVEKPMANSLAACTRMLDVSRENGRVLTVGFNHRYFDAVKDVRAAVQSGAIGRLCYVRGFAGHTGLAEFKSRWMYDKRTMGGGALLDNGIHVLDLVRNLMGEIGEVYGTVSSGIWGLDVEDNAFATFRGVDGVIGTLNASWSEWKGYCFYVEAYGDKGMARAYYAPMMTTIITMNEPGGRRRVARRFYPSVALREKICGWQSTVIRTFQQEFADFAALVAGEQPSGPIARAEDGFRSIEIANAVYTASNRGESVRLAAEI